MAESVYRQDYLNERLQLWVDNLNLLYVAFTRAGKNLIVWSRKDQKGTMSELLSAALPQVAKAEEGGWDEEGASMKAERYIRRKRRSFTAFGRERTRMRTLRTGKAAL